MNKKSPIDQQVSRWGYGILLLFLTASSEKSWAQTAWQTAPATPVTSGSVQRPVAIAQNTSSARLIPFDPATYRAVDLAPPPTIGTSSVQSLPAPQALQGSNSDADRNVYPRLPNANQLLPQAPRSSNIPTAETFHQERPSSKLPPLPDAPVTSHISTAPHSMERSESGPSASFVSFQSRPVDVTPPSTVRSDFQASETIAVVGSDRILVGDLAAVIEPIIHENKAKLDSKQKEENVRLMLVRQVLPQYIEMKALYQEYFRDIAGNVAPDELKKMKDQINSRASRVFFEKFVPRELFKRHDVKELSELEAKLQETGLSIAVVKNHFLLQVLASELENKYVPEDYEIPPQEILAYYQQHAQEWQIPARAKWRQLTARFDQYADRAEAERDIQQMGNEVVLGGKSFEAVARDSSNGYTASEGGMHDWTTEGSLKSEPLNQAIFSIPLNRLSDLIVDDLGIHIIEVVEREAARTQDMAEIQSEIRKRLSRERRDSKAEEFRKKVMDRTVVWTKWPEDIPGSRPLADALGTL